MVSDETILLVTKAVVVVLLVILFIYDSIHKDSKSKEKKSRIPAIFKSSYLEAGLFFVLSHFDYISVYGKMVIFGLTLFSDLLLT